MRRQPVKSAARTLEVFELFSERRCPLRLHDIHSALDYPQSSTTNLLKSMVMLGYLSYSRVTRTYLPTNRVALLGNWLPSFLYGQQRYQDHAGYCLDCLSARGAGPRHPDGSRRRRIDGADRAT